MSRIEIKVGDRHVIVEHDGELEPIKTVAIEVMKVAESIPLGSPGPAVGFQADRRWTPGVNPTGNSAYDRGRPCAPVDAKEAR